MERSYDVAVIGAGAFGSWSAWHLARAGASVLLLDAWGPGHTRSSSGCESRILRAGYGADEIYTRMAMQSLPQWRGLGDRAGQPFFHPTGVLFLARENDPYSMATCETLRRAGVTHERLSKAALAERFPQMQLDPPGMFGIYEPESGALLARRAVAAVVAEAVVSGATYATESASVAGDGVRTQSGEAIRAGAFVFACGPWLPKVFPEVLGARIFPTRQEIFFFAPPAGDRRFAPPAFPSWVDFTDPRGPFGVPDLESRGFKIGLDRHGPEFDPDTGDRRVSAEGLAEVRRFLAERFPALAEAPLTESRVCQYENSSSGDFLIDRHPDLANMWLVGGGSGHGFKHGPAVGEYVAQRVLGRGPAEARFSLAAKRETQARTVY